MSCIVNFTDLSSLPSLSTNAQFFIYRNDGSLTGSANFGRATLLVLNNSLPVNSTVSANSSVWGGSGTYVTTLAQLNTALADANVKRIILGADITLSAAFTTIPKTLTINFNGYKFIKSSSAKIFYYGGVEAERYQIFSGFAEGDIRGNFNSQEIYPEWWGLVNNKHQDAINAAIRSRVDTGSPGNIISLAAGNYYVSAPIDLVGSHSVLKGAGAGRTDIIATNAFPWPTSAYLNNTVYGLSSHTAIIWMGGDYSAAALSGTADRSQTYRTGVEGIGINAFSATWQYGGPLSGKFVSGISCRGNVEENSFIINTSVANAGGFGIGFAATTATLPTIINGLEIRCFWITNTVSVSSYPIYLPEWCNNVVVQAGTIDVGVVSSASLANSAAILTGDSGNMPFSAIRYFPEIGIQIDGGKTFLSNIHIEGPTIGIRVSTQGSSPAFCVLNSIAGNYLWDYDTIFEENPAKMAQNNSPPPALSAQRNAFPNVTSGNIQIEPYLRKYSTLVLIAKSDKDLASMGSSWFNVHGAKNYESRVVINNLQSLGNVRYLLRDPAYGINISTYGQGGNVGFYSAAYGGVTQYVRGVAVPVITSITYDASGNATTPLSTNFQTAAGAMTNPTFSYWAASSHTDRQYYQLII